MDAQKSQKLLAIKMTLDPDHLRRLENLAKAASRFIEDEFEEEVKPIDILNNMLLTRKLNLAYTTTEDESYEIEATINLVTLTLNRTFTSTDNIFMETVEFFDDIEEVIISLQNFRWSFEDLTDASFLEDYAA